MIDNRWCGRNLDLLPPNVQEVFVNEATHACAFKRDMVAHNIFRVRQLNQPIAPIDAISSGKDARGRAGDKESGLPDKIIFCRAANSHVLTGLRICP